MKKIYWVGALLVLIFIGDRIGGFVLSKVIANSRFRYARMYQDKAQSDILLVGNSRGLIFFQPYIEELTGKKTFNLSYNGMPADLAAVLVKDYFDRYPAPGSMVVDVTICDRINKPLIAGFNAYAPYSKRLRTFITEKNTTMGYGARFSHLFRYNNEIFQRSLFYMKESDENWLTDRIMNQNLVDSAAGLPAYHIDFEPHPADKAYLLKMLDDIIKTARSKGTKVTLVINPYYPEFAKKIENLETFKARITSYTGLEVHDYSSFVKESKGFSDYQHLNKYGAKLYLDRLKEDGILID